MTYTPHDLSPTDLLICTFALKAASKVRLVSWRRTTTHLCTLFDLCMFCLREKQMRQRCLHVCLRCHTLIGHVTCEQVLPPPRQCDLSTYCVMTVINDTVCRHVTLYYSVICRRRSFFNYASLFGIRADSVAAMGADWRKNLWVHRLNWRFFCHSRISPVLHIGVLYLYLQTSCTLLQVS